MPIKKEGPELPGLKRFFEHGPTPIMRAVILIRLLVGLVFLSEGIQKFLFSPALGVGRFEKIGIPYPGFTAPFVGVVEIVCGGLVVIGLLTKLACLPLLIDICTSR